MSNDLISRSALMDALRGNVLVDVTPELEDAISALPTAYDVDKVIEQLEKKAEEYYNSVNPSLQFKRFCRGIGDGHRFAIEIVKAGGINE